MDIDKLEDRELDVAVAEAKGAIVKPHIYSGDLVMASGQDMFEASMKHGYWQWNVESQSGKVTFCCPLPKWHSDIAAAWELWQELKADGYDTSVYEEGDGLMSFYVCRDKCEECLRRNEVAICYFHDLDELPTAIARAYLKALKAKASD